MILILILLFISIPGKSQDQPVTDSLFVVIFTTGPAWDAAKPPGEQPNFKEHSANLGRLRKEGVIKLGGRYADKGMIIFSANSTAAAKAMIDSDPGVASKLFNADLQKLNMFYFGCLEKPKQ